MATAQEIPIIIEFGGGAELLFNNQKKLTVNLKKENDEDKWTVSRVIQWLKENRLKERCELFVQGNSVRPGILVLINETDWELMGELQYEIQNNDHLLFISTLHGG